MTLHPGDRVLVIGTIETITGQQLLVNINGHNIQLTENNLAHHQGEPVTDHA